MITENIHGNRQALWYPNGQKDLTHYHGRVISGKSIRRMRSFNFRDIENCKLIDSRIPVVIC